MPATNRRNWIKGAVLSIVLGIIGIGGLPGRRALAHGGGLDSTGGHNCYVAACAGEYHCHQPSWGCGTGVESNSQSIPDPTPFYDPNNDWLDREGGFYFEGTYYSSLDQWYLDYELPRLSQKENSSSIGNLELTSNNPVSSAPDEGTIPLGFVVLVAASGFFIYLISKKS